MSAPIAAVPIRPGVSVLSILRHLNYKPWFALAEFVDNAVQSYLVNRAQLESLHGPGFKLCVRIDVEPTAPTRLTVRDNAAGIARADFPRAFRPAAIPPDRSGLSEFGMGMKSAAC
ncbi:MAG: ATP-binding protein, partial [Mesorhizobium sp.]